MSSRLSSLRGSAPALDRSDGNARTTHQSVILAICCFSVFVAGIDATIVNVALPDIQHSLHTSVSGLQWTIDAYTLVIACISILAGSLADRFGRRLAFQTGLLLFSVGSLLCGWAPSLGWLVTFRCVQAAGGSLLNPVALSIIVTAIPSPRGLAKAVGVWGSVAGVSLASGPVIGGALVSGFGWRSIFWVNVPLGVVAIVLAQRYVPESKSSKPRKLDIGGEILICAMLGSVTAAIIEGPRIGWASPFSVALFAVAAIATVALIQVESRVDQPLVNLGFFRSAPFSGAIGIAVVGPITFGGFYFISTLYLQDVRGYSALQAGLRMIPMALMLGAFSNLSGVLVNRYGPRLPFALAGLLLTVGSVMQFALGRHSATWYVLVAFAVFGAGSGLTTAPMTNATMAGMPPDQAGVAGAVASTGRMFGSAVGVAICGSLVTATAGDAFIHSNRIAWMVMTGCAIGVFILGWMSTSSWAMDTARRTRERLELADLAT